MDGRGAFQHPLSNGDRPLGVDGDCCKAVCFCECDGGDAQTCALTAGRQVNQDQALPQVQLRPHKSSPTANPRDAFSAVVANVAVYGPQERR